MLVVQLLIILVVLVENARKEARGLKQRIVSLEVKEEKVRINPMKQGYQGKVSKIPVLWCKVQLNLI